MCAKSQCCTGAKLRFLVGGSCLGLEIIPLLLRCFRLDGNVKPKVLGNRGLETREQIEAKGQFCE